MTDKRRQMSVKPEPCNAGYEKLELLNSVAKNKPSEFNELCFNSVSQFRPILQQKHRI